MIDKYILLTQKLSLYWIKQQVSDKQNIEDTCFSMYVH